jgi:hypothetical protein
LAFPDFPLARRRSPQRLKATSNGKLIVGRHTFLPKILDGVAKNVWGVAFLTSDYERRIGDQPLMNTNQRRLSSSRDELPRFAFIRVRLGNGINDFLLKAPGAGQRTPEHGSSFSSPLGNRRSSRLLIFAKFLKARIAAERVEHWIETEQRRSERYVCSQRAPVWYRK